MHVHLNTLAQPRVLCWDVCNGYLLHVCIGCPGDPCILLKGVRHVLDMGASYNRTFTYLTSSHNCKAYGYSEHPNGWTDVCARAVGPGCSKYPSWGFLSYAFARTYCAKTCGLCSESACSDTCFNACDLEKGKSAVVAAYTSAWGSEKQYHTRWHSKQVGGARLRPKARTLQLTFIVFSRARETWN